MKKGLLIGLAVVLLCMVQSPARGQEEPTLTELHKVLRDRGAKWQAGETSMNKLDPQERKRRLGLGLTRPSLVGLEHKRLSAAMTSASSGSTGSSAPVAAPPTFDWRNNGGNYVTAIKNQGSCGSCWAFATTAALESAVLRQQQTPGVELNLSEQMVVSCSGAGDCERGGSLNGAADFMKTYGLAPENCYPYTGTDGTCSAACAGWQTSGQNKLSNWYLVGSPATVDQLKDALYNHGPMPVTMAVYSDFFSYAGGVYHHVSGGIAGYHAILLIGYDDANQCFIVKNSWGTWWGEQGFFRIAYSEVTGDSGFGDWALVYVMTDPTCSYTSKINQTGVFPYKNATGTASVTTSSGCSWTADGLDSWIKVTSGGTGKGNGTVSFSLDDNTTGSTRNGTLMVAGQSYSISQSNTCGVSLNPTIQSFTTAGGSGSIGVTCISACPWTATSSASWVTVTSGASGSGNGTVSYSVSANAGPARTGTITIGGYTFYVSQAGAYICSYSITPTAQNLTGSAGTGTVNVIAPSGCTWTASSYTSWITITSGASGSGNGSVGYSVTANTGSSSRSGTLNISGNTFTVTQAAGGTCTSSITPTSQNFTASTGAGTVSVTSGTGCAWSATSNASWLTITSGSSGSGNGSVGYSVTANTSSSSRSGTLTIGGNTFTVTQAGGTCTATITPTSQNFTSSAGTGTVGVTSPSGCAWTASSNAPWITITSGSSGSGNGTVSYSVAANTSSTSHSGSLTIAGNTFSVAQAGAACTYFITPTSQTFTGSAGTGTVNVTSPSGCAWTAASNNTSWITVTSGSSGSGNGTVTYSVASNPTTLSRWDVVNVAGQAHTVSQAGGSGCTYDVSPASQSFTTIASVGSVAVTSNRGCAWSATSNASWITINAGTSGSGNGYVTFVTTANTGASRTGTLTVAGKTATVTQAGSTCTSSITPTSQTLTASAGTGTVSVTSGTGCAWSATSNNTSWLSVTSGASGSGNGTVGYSVTANTSTTSRSGTITIAGSTFTVAQAGMTCTYSISPISNSLTSAAGTGSVGVTCSGTSCSWTAVSNATSWLTVTGGSSGSGNGTVNYAVTANTGATSRSGTITIAGQTFTVNQAAMTCSYSISPTSNSLSSSAGSGSVGVTSPSGCAWTASSNNTSWLSVTSGASGSGNGTVGYSATANTSTASRSGTITIAGSTFTVTQAGMTCTYSISPMSNSLTSAAGTGSVGVTCSGTSCSWTAVSNATSWLTVTGGSSGSGNGTVGYSVSANTSTASRSGTITIAGSTFTVTQAGAATCMFSITPTSQNFTDAAITGTVSVTSASGCAWTATSNASWIMITSGTSGSGNGSAGYSVAANRNTSSRSGTLTVAGKTFAVTQAGAATCAFSITPTIQNFSGSAGTGTVSVTSPSGCAWTAASNNTSWITVTSGSSGSGNGTVTYTVAANPSTSSRWDVINIAGQSHTVSQAGSSCTYDVSPVSQSFSALASAGSVLITPSARSCAWTATSNAAWITITSSASGSGSAYVSYYTTANTGVARTGTLTVAGKTVTVTQQAPTPTIFIDPWAFDFGTINKGTSSVQTVNVKNSGPGELNVTSVSVDTMSGTIVSFSQSNNCNTIKPTGSSSCTISVKFAPGGTSTQNTYLYIYSNGGTAKVPIRGTAK